MVEILRKARGYVEFTISGVYPQKLLAGIRNEGIEIWDIVPLKYGFRAKMHLKDYKKLKRLSKDCYLRSKINSRNGLVVNKKARRRYLGMLFGVMLSAVILLAMSRVVWVVEVFGAESIDDNEIKAMLADMGVSPGVLRSSINTNNIERELMMAEERIGWVGVNVKGSRVEVELHQVEPPPELIDDKNIAANIVASKTGFITSMDVYVGQAFVKKGDAVVKGDILISGITLDDRGKTMLYEARGDVIAEVYEELTATVSLKEKVVVPTEDVVEKKYLNILGLKIPIAGSRVMFEDYIVKTTETPLVFNITMITDNYIRVEEEIREVEPQKAHEILLKKEELAFIGEKIVSKDYLLNDDGFFATAKGSYIVEQNIGTSVQIALKGEDDDRN